MRERGREKKDLRETEEKSEFPPLVRKMSSPPLVIPDPRTREGLCFLDSRLSARSFVRCAWGPTQDDAAIFAAVGGGSDQKMFPSKELPHLARWHRHLASYGQEGRRKLPAPEDGAVLESLSRYQQVRRHTHTWNTWKLSLTTLLPFFHLAPFSALCRTWTGCPYPY